MAEIVMRVRLMSGDQLGVRYDEQDAVDETETVQRVIETLAEDAGGIRCPGASMTRRLGRRRGFLSSAGCSEAS